MLKTYPYLKKSYLYLENGTIARPSKAIFFVRAGIQGARGDQGGVHSAAVHTTATPHCTLSDHHHYLASGYRPFARAAHLSPLRPIRCSVCVFV